MEKAMLNFDNLGRVRMRVRNTFIELHEPNPEIKRRSSVPAGLRHAFGLERIGSSRCAVEGNAKVDASAGSSCFAFGGTLDRAVLLQDALEVHSQAEGGDASQKTTLMLCDLPLKVSYERLILECKSLGFDGKYDFLYLPKRNAADRTNLGYCFINLMSAEDAACFIKKFTHHRFAEIQSPKTMRVKIAEVQGREASLTRFASSKKFGKGGTPYLMDTAGIRAPAEMKLQST
eukprot:TRINITY_DN31782_c0_g1_i1.p1 TRINITY_DN31782_c0_g1~~TRINITY_DN31782_c0_g1_i1.p1  ORF type:complete len:232 (+),score=39.37 TRINITY_DN31782_c0_g1_i1:53-748(+)